MITRDISIKSKQKLWLDLGIGNKPYKLNQFSKMKKGWFIIQIFIYKTTTSKIQDYKKQGGF